MGIILSRRVGSDPYYLSYEKSFEKITAKETLIKERQSKRHARIHAYVRWSWTLAMGWLALVLGFFGYAQRSGWINKWPIRRSMMMGGVGLAVTALLVLLGVLVDKLLRALESRDAVYLKRLAESRKKMLKELKDSTHFEKTMALLRKYDPDAKPPPSSLQTGVHGGQRLISAPPVGHASSPFTPGQLLARTGNMAGKALSPMLQTLANTVIGDNPELMEQLRRMQWEAEQLRKENDTLRRQLGQPGAAGPLSAPLFGGGGATVNSEAGTEAGAAQAVAAGAPFSGFLLGPDTGTFALGPASAPLLAPASDGQLRQSTANSQRSSGEGEDRKGSEAKDSGMNGDGAAGAVLSTPKPADEKLGSGMRQRAARS